MAFTHVEDRVRRALEYIDMQGVSATALVVVGGVAANLELRRYVLIYAYILYVYILYVCIYCMYILYVYIVYVCMYICKYECMYVQQ